MSSYFDNKNAFLEPKVSQYGGHMVMTNVQKTLKRKIINMDSRFKDDYTTNRNSNININLDDSYLASYSQKYTFTLPERINDVKSLTVVDIEIPMSFNNISKNMENNVFKIGSKTITLRDGQYVNNTGLVNEVTYALNSGSVNDILFSISNNFATFTNSSNSQSYTITFDINGLGENDKYNFKSKLGWLMGFRNLSYTIPPNSVLKGESFVDLTAPKYLYLAIDEFGNGNQSSFLTPISKGFISKNVVSKITLDRSVFPFGNNVVLPANLYNGLLLSDNRSYSGKIDIQKLTVQLINEYGIPIDLNGLDFSFAFEVIHE